MAFHITHSMSMRPIKGGEYVRALIFQEMEPITIHAYHITHFSFGLNVTSLLPLQPPILRTT